MLALLVAIACSSSIALAFKLVGPHNLNRLVVIGANYLTATAVGVLGFVLRDRAPTGEPFTVGSALHDVRCAVATGGTVTTEAGALAWAVLVGLGAGVLFFLAFVYYERSVTRYGAGLAGAMIKLGTFLPMTLSLVLWREWPGPWQWAGIALAAGAILIVNWPGELGWRASLRPALLLLFLLGGGAEFSNKVFQNYAGQALKAAFLLTTFAGAFLYSGIIIAVRRERVILRDVGFGLLLGVPNVFSSWFLIAALETIPASVAYPIFSAGSIVLISVVGVGWFRERLTRREWVGIALTILALVLVNIARG